MSNTKEHFCQKTQVRLKTFLGWSGAKKDIKETPKVEETQTAGFFKSVVVVVAAVVAGGNNVVVV